MNTSEEERARNSKLRVMLMRVAAATAALMLCFEAAKQLLIPHITLWVSHFITICFTTVLGVSAAYVVGRQLMKLGQERSQLQGQLLQAQKIEAIGRLAGGIAHDFNNLLTVMFAYCSRLQKRPSSDPELTRDVAGIQEAADRAAALTHQLLAFSRKQFLRPQLLNLNDLVCDLEKMLRRTISEDIEITAVAAPDLGWVKADRTQLEQILMNLAVNAQDAMPKGGKLTLETGNVLLDESYSEKHFSVESGRYVMLAVSDTGTGMDSKTQARMFEPFFTTKEIGKGTGLGLAMVYGIVKQSGGYVWVYSELGRGTTFKIYLPRVDGPGEEGRAQLEAAVAAGNLFGSLSGDAAGQAASQTILLVEDEQELRRVAEATLVSNGYTVLAATDAAQAEQLCSQHEGKIDLLLTDVVMPGADGWELARRLSEQRPEMKVIYMSGYTDKAIPRPGAQDTNLVFLQKPFTPSGLSTRIREVLSGKI
jgi:two-component system, cell cycle sensor histidine kinase and response regulator CckA